MKRIPYVAIALILVFVAAAFAGVVTLNNKDLSGPNGRIWNAINDLQTQINNIPAGSQGPQGEQGPQGIPGEQGPAGNDGADGATVHFGEWSDFTTYKLDTQYTAATDGFVIVHSALDSEATQPVYVNGYTPDGMEKMFIKHEPGSTGSFMFPVRAGDTWNVYPGAYNPADIVYVHCYILWIPLSA